MGLLRRSSGLKATEGDNCTMAYLLRNKEASRIERGEGARERVTHDRPEERLLFGCESHPMSMGAV
jgi:hypothetical protein